MRKEYKVLICILALIFSIGATCIGFGLIGSYMLGCYRIAQKVSLLEGFE